MLNWLNDILATPEEKTEKKLKAIAEKFVDFSAEQAGSYFSVIVPALDYLLGILDVVHNEEGEFTKFHQLETIQGIIPNMASINLYVTSVPFVYCFKMCEDKKLPDQIISVIPPEKQRAFMGAVITSANLYDEMVETIDVVIQSLSTAGKIAAQQFEQSQTDADLQQTKLLRHFVDIDKSQFFVLCEQAQEINDTPKK
ncbi:MAG: hypothetical protein ACRDBQ_25445 [Shewanella sp.]